MNKNHTKNQNISTDGEVFTQDSNEKHGHNQTRYVMRRRRHRGHTTHKKIYSGRKYRGWSVICVITLCAFGLSTIKPFTTFSISPLIIAVLLGAFFANVSHDIVNLFKKTNIMAYSTKQILRLGIILYGFRITINDINVVGFNGLLMAFLMVFTTFFVGFILGRAIGIDKKSAVLISAGSAICGAAAVLATESIIRGGPKRVGVAVCTVVVFGTLCMFGFPLAYKLGFIHLNINEMGFFLGGTLHEVAHAVAAGNSVGGEAVNLTIIIKMLRVLMLVPFLIMISLGSSYFSGSKEKKRGKIRNSIPYFAIWFLVMVGFGSLIPADIREAQLPVVNLIDTLLLSVSMVALGLSMRKDVLLNAGIKPFILAIILLLWLIGAGYILSYFLA